MNINELMAQIKCNRNVMATDQESILTYQDVIGHSSIQQNIDASNSNDADLFFRIYGEAYGVNAAIQFFIDHSLYCSTLRNDNSMYKVRIDDYKKTIESKEEMISNINRKNVDLEIKNQNLLEQVESLTDEIIRLKAKLYDILEKA